MVLGLKIEDETIIDLKTNAPWKTAAEKVREREQQPENIEKERVQPNVQPKRRRQRKRRESTPKETTSKKEERVRPKRRRQSKEERAPTRTHTFVLKNNSESHRQSLRLGRNARYARGRVVSGGRARLSFVLKSKNILRTKVSPNLREQTRRAGF